MVELPARFFTSRIITLRNGLPESIVCCTWLGPFKWILDWLRTTVFSDFVGFAAPISIFHSYDRLEHLAPFCYVPDSSDDESSQNPKNLNYGSKIAFPTLFVFVLNTTTVVAATRG